MIRSKRKTRMATALLGTALAVATFAAAPAAADLMSTTVGRLRQQWLQSAVTIANVLKGGQTVHRGTFDDLRQLRENYEELERARQFLRGMGAPADPVPENGDVAAAS